MLVGEHDFRAFGASPRAGGATVRRIEQAGWQADSDELRFEVVGNAFLYHMVRRMVSLQVAVGQGKMSIAEMSAYIDPQESEVYVQGLAPAHGLCLVAVEYPAERLATN
jgi:tRNA pseudouridine38-40 synthase